MFGLGPTELIVILVVALIIFGPKRLPEMGKQIGKAINEFKRSSQEIQDQVTKSISLEDEKNSTTTTTTNPS